MKKNQLMNNTGSPGINRITGSTMNDEVTINTATHTTGATFITGTMAGTANNEALA